MMVLENRNFAIRIPICKACKLRSNSLHKGNRKGKLGLTSTPVFSPMRAAKSVMSHPVVAITKGISFEWPSRYATQLHRQSWHLWRRLYHYRDHLAFIYIHTTEEFILHYSLPLLRQSHEIAFLLRKYQSLCHPEPPSKMQYEGRESPSQHQPLAQ